MSKHDSCNRWIECDASPIEQRVALRRPSYGWPAATGLGLAALALVSVAFSALPYSSRQQKFLPQHEEERPLNAPHGFSSESRRMQTAEGPDKCQDDTRWEELPWRQLSDIEKNSWQTLGWTEQTWNNFYLKPTTTPFFGPAPENTTTTTTGTTTSSTTYRPFADTYCFQNLTTDRQDAVLTLGYNIQSWHACKNPSCPWPYGIPKPDAPCLDHLVYLDQKYNPEKVMWYNFTYDTQKALVDLGWDGLGKRWKDADTPAVYAMWWEDMMPREREAATFLGYRSDSWERCQKESLCVTRKRMQEVKEDRWIWETMPSGIQQRLRRLGWRKREWTEGEEPASYKILFAELPLELQAAALQLGYTEDMWNRCPVDPCLDRFKYVQEKFKGNTIPWMSMKLAVRRSWILLGYSQEMWTDQMRPVSFQKRWDELSPEQQVQAKLLGYSMGAWQGCNMDWKPSGSEGRFGNHSEVHVELYGDAVRGRMKIQRPFAEISGNVYGQQVATMPVSFIQMFERSVSRALFCGNPPVSNSPNTYLDDKGNPLCILKEDYDRQRQRIEVLTVVEGSIIVDFTIRGNSSLKDDTSKVVYENLARQVMDQKSPLCQDVEFGYYATVATLKEIPITLAEWEARQKALNFEQLRKQYSNANGCLLYTDFRLDITDCSKKSKASGSHVNAFVTLMAVLFALVLTTPSY